MGIYFKVPLIPGRCTSERGLITYSKTKTSTKSLQVSNKLVHRERGPCPLRFTIYNSPNDLFVMPTYTCLTSEGIMGNTRWPAALANRV